MEWAKLPLYEFEMETRALPEDAMGLFVRGCRWVWINEDDLPGDLRIVAKLLGCQIQRLTKLMGILEAHGCAIRRFDRIVLPFARKVLDEYFVLVAERSRRAKESRHRRGVDLPEQLLRVSKEIDGNHQKSHDTARTSGGPLRVPQPYPERSSEGPTIGVSNSANENKGHPQYQLSTAPQIRGEKISSKETLQGVSLLPPQSQRHDGIVVGARTIEFYNGTKTEIFRDLPDGKLRDAACAKAHQIVVGKPEAAREFILALVKQEYRRLEGSKRPRSNTGSLASQLCDRDALAKVTSFQGGADVQSS